MTKGSEKRVVPIKNYIILVVLFVAFILLIAYLCNWYYVYKDYQKETPVIRGEIAEITLEEMEHYMLENPETILYLCTSYDDVCRDFEKEFVTYLKKDYKNKNVTYLNLSDVKQTEFISDFNQKYHYRVKLTDYYPAFIVFNENRVIDMIQGKKDNKLTMKEVKEFLKGYKREE